MMARSLAQIMFSTVVHRYMVQTELPETLLRLNICEVTFFRFSPPPSGTWSFAEFTSDHAAAAVPGAIARHCWNVGRCYDKREGLTKLIGRAIGSGLDFG